MDNEHKNSEAGKKPPRPEPKTDPEKNTKAVEPNNPKAEHPAPDQMDEKDLPPFQAGKPVIQFLAHSPAAMQYRENRKGIK